MVGPSVHWYDGWSVGLFIRPSVCHTLLFFCGFWRHCSCPNDLVTSITAPTHLHATGVAVYLALFSTNRPKKVKDELKICFIMNWLAEMQILAIIAHLWPVFGLLWSRHQCSTLSKTIPWNPTLVAPLFKGYPHLRDNTVWSRSFSGFSNVKKPLYKEPLFKGYLDLRDKFLKISLHQEKF